MSYICVRVKHVHSGQLQTKYLKPMRFLPKRHVAIYLTLQLFIDTVHALPHLNHCNLFVIAFLERICTAKAQGPEPIVITGCLALVITVIYAHNNTHMIKNTLKAPQYEWQIFLHLTFEECYMVVNVASLSFV